MEDVCIVCNRAIEWSSEDREQPAASTSSANNGADTGSPSSAAMQRTSSSNRSSNTGTAAAHPPPAPSSASSKAVSGKRSSHHATHHHHQHHHHHAVRGHHTHARIRRNHSHGKLEGSSKHHAKSGLKPLTSTAASNAAAISAAVNAIVNEASQQRTSTEGSASDAITSENLPDWMAIYCSEECRNEDELRSRLSFANLTEERERSLLSSAAARTQSSNGGRAYSSSSLSPTFGPAPSASAFGQLVDARNASSPWCNDSEDSEFDWHHQHHSLNQHTKESHHAHSSTSRHRATSSRDSSDIIATSGSEGRRYSDASDSSRLSVYNGRPPTLHAPHARRSSSRTRGSTDSLASLGSSGYDLYSSSGGAGGHTRPDMVHRSTSALSGGLRAMTPIHHQPTSTSASPRMTSPGRLPRNTNSATSPTTAEAPKKEDVPAPSTSSGTTASIFIPSNISGQASTTQPEASGSLNLASSTYIAPSSAKTFRPASISRSANGGSFLKPSKSSATLALSAAEDVRATMVAERRESHSPVRRPSNAMSRTHSGHHHHRTSHHTSTSSIPYLSCSPSSPGSGSMNSGRSNVSTDPSSSSMRGDGEYCDDGDSDDGEYQPLPRKNEDERNVAPSLSSYGLFYQRTPSTPSLPSLMQQSSYGRSPPAHSFGARNARLSSSYDTKNAGSTTISSVFRERQNRPSMQNHPTSSSLRMTPSNGMHPVSSPRRATFDLSASYQQAPRRNQSSSKLHPGHPSHAQSDNTPTQSGLASRSQSFVGHYGRMVEEPAYEVVQEVKKDEHGRTRAPSITRTDLERVSSDRSLSSGQGRAQGVETTRSSSSTLQRLPSHLRPATLSPQQSHDVLPSPPISPGLYNQHGSQTGINQLVSDEAAYGRPLLANARSKSRSSFTWDHLPAYVPQYAALDLDRVRRNKSGTSLHSVYEEEAEQSQSIPSSQQSTVKSLPQNASRKRLFYFPGADDH